MNAKFAEVVAAESTTDSPVMLIQDFHFALLPRLIRARIPKATIVLFWHIPWPNAETFGVCPWKREMLLHMLSADILGFHTRYHCQNFLDTVDRFVECQIDHEHMTVTLRVTCAASLPTRYRSSGRRDGCRILPDVATCRASVRAAASASVPDVTIGLGVERWDFTKGILERSRRWRHCWTRIRGSADASCLLQIAAPSRSQLPAYQRSSAAYIRGSGADQREIRGGRMAADHSHR